MANEVTTTKPTGSLAIAANKIANVFISDLANLNEAVGVPVNDESKRCAVNAILALCSDLGAETVQKLPKAQLVQVLQFVTLNGLDVLSGQVFLDKRFNKRTGEWSVKATPMGNAYEIMVRRFGADVASLSDAFIVHEEDVFEMPQFDGIKMTMPKLLPTLKGLDGKAIAAYYIITKKDGSYGWVCATRESVSKNLMAQILNATLREEDVNRAELMKHLEGKTLDELLSDDYLARWISPAYRSPASRESMIVGKMKKNCLLHYCRDIGTPASRKAAELAEEAEGSDMLATNQEPIDFTGKKPAIPQDNSAKVNDFEVEESPAEVVEPKQEEPQKPVQEAPTTKVEDKKPNPGEGQGPAQGSIFDLDDL